MANPERVPDDWVQISEGDTVVPPCCNHVGMLEWYRGLATCVNCLAQWASPERARAPAQPGGEA